MRVNTKAVVIALFALAGGLVGAAQAKTVDYPSHGKASFTVDVPDSWKVIPAKTEGDYTDLESPGGTVMQLRTLEVSKQALNEFVKEENDYIAKNYADVKMTLSEKDCKLNGLECSVSHGTGKEKDGGAQVNLTSGVFALNDGKIGEIWYVAPVADKAGIADAAKIFSSYKSP